MRAVRYKFSLDVLPDLYAPCKVRIKDCKRFDAQMLGVEILMWYAKNAALYDWWVGPTTAARLHLVFALMGLTQNRPHSLPKP